MPGLFISGGSFLALVTVCVFLGYYRYPLFLQAPKTEIEKKRYEKSSLTGVDTERVHSRLMELVETEKLLASTQAKLANESFVSKAPAQVVDGVRAKEAELQELATRIRENLAQ